jgi:hypothetical protein
MHISAFKQPRCAASLGDYKLDNVEEKRWLRSLPTGGARCAPVRAPRNARGPQSDLVGSEVRHSHHSPLSHFRRHEPVLGGSRQRLVLGAREPRQIHRKRRSSSEKNRTTASSSLLLRSTMRLCAMGSTWCWRWRRLGLVGGGRSPLREPRRSPRARLPRPQPAGAPRRGWRGEPGEARRPSPRHCRRAPPCTLPQQPRMHPPRSGGSRRP